MAWYGRFARVHCTHTLTRLRPKTTTLPRSTTPAFLNSLIYLCWVSVEVLTAFLVGMNGPFFLRVGSTRTLIYKAVNCLGRWTWRFFFALVTAGRIRDRIFLDRFPKKIVNFFGYFKLVKFVIVTHRKWGVSEVGKK